MTENEKAEIEYEKWKAANYEKKTSLYNHPEADRHKAFIDGFIAGQKSLLTGSVGETLRNQEKQIQEMKCCGNCKYEDEDVPWCSHCCNHDRWELA